MKNYLYLLMSALLTFSCTLNSDDPTIGGDLGQIDISDAKLLYVESIKKGTSIGERGAHSLYKVTHDGVIEKVPLKSTNGKDLKVSQMGIAEYNKESIMLLCNISEYIIDKKTNKITRIPEELKGLSGFTFGHQNGMGGFNQDYQDNLYRIEQNGDSWRLCKYTRNLQKEILHENYEGDFYAFDMYGNGIIHKEKQICWYRKNNGDTIRLNLPSSDFKAGAFGLKDREGFYCIDQVEGENTTALFKLELDMQKQEIRPYIVSNKLAGETATGFRAVYYRGDKVVIISSKEAIIIDRANNISIEPLADQRIGDMTLVYDALYWFGTGSNNNYPDYNECKRFNLSTLKVEDVYSSILSGYRIGAVSIELDETIVAYGVDSQTEQQKVLKIKDGAIVSIESGLGQYIRQVSHILEL